MSVRRWRLARDDGDPEPYMKESELGGWVDHADYADLKAEVDRLRKAGDELARVAIPSYILDVKTRAIEAWLAAKGERP